MMSRTLLLSPSWRPLDRPRSRAALVPSCFLPLATTGTLGAPLLAWMQCGLAGRVYLGTVLGGGLAVDRVLGGPGNGDHVPALDGREPTDRDVVFQTRESSDLDLGSVHGVSRDLGHDMVEPQLSGRRP